MYGSLNITNISRNDRQSITNSLKNCHWKTFIIRRKHKSLTLLI